MPATREAFRLLACKLSLSLVLGNHDYDAMWSDARWVSRLPTIVTTQDYLNSDGSRTANLITDMKAVDPQHSSVQALWDELFSRWLMPPDTRDRRPPG